MSSFERNISEEDIQYIEILSTLLDETVNE